MYKNIGKKIKTLTVVITVLLMIAAVAVGVFFAMNEDTRVLGIIIIVAGLIVPYFLSWFVYGYGELIDKTAETAKLVAGGATATTADGRTAQLMELFDRGILTADEVKQKLG